MSMHRRSKARTVISILIGFLISVCLLIFVYCFELSIGLLNNKSINRALNNSHYKSNAYEEFCNKSDKIFEEQGIKIVSRNIFPEDEVYLDYLNVEKASLNGEYKPVSQEEMTSKVSTLIKKELAENEVLNLFETDADEFNDVIEYNSGEVAKLYMRYMQPQFIYELKCNNDSYRNRAIIAMIISVVVMAILIVLVLMMYKHKTKAARFILAGVLSAGITNVITMWIVFSYFDAGKLGLAKGAYLTFVNAYLNDIKIPFVAGSVVTILVGVVSIYVTVIAKRSRNRKRS